MAYYISLVKKGTPEQGLRNLDLANRFVLSDGDKDDIAKKKVETFSNLIDKLVASSKYKQALDLLQRLVKDDPENTDLLYRRAVCYIKLGTIHLAASDLKIAGEHGNLKAGKLYNKINPICKRIAYRVTRCCDGSTSDAAGRGACSHHGGVCNWSEPVYEEYRRY